MSKKKDKEPGPNWKNMYGKSSPSEMTPRQRRRWIKKNYHRVGLEK